MEKSAERLNVLKRIEELEKQGRFNEDVEDDAPTSPILPKDVDYTDKKLSSKLLTKLANHLAVMFFESMIKKNKLIIKEVVGLENAKIEGGAIVTCNHFNLRDVYVVYRTMKPVLKKKQRIWKIIKESNYTNFKGPVRLMMRHANTLPLSSNRQTMKELLKSIKTLLDRGEKIMIYPEQAMWWNYRKPRPLKPGAFKFAAKNNVPVLPVFITMNDTEFIDEDGFPVQEYTVHYLPPIYPDKNLSLQENERVMCEKNYQLWVETYEKFYGEKLVYCDCAV